MLTPNRHYGELKDSYLFARIAEKTAAYLREHPGKKLLRMGIGEAGGVVRYWHPTFLYESVWNLIGFILLHNLSKKRKYDGQTFLQYLAWYGLGRFWIEGLRTDSLYLFGTGIRVSQLLAGLSFLLSVGVMLYIRLYKNPDGSGMLVNQVAKNGEAETEEADAPVEDAADTPVEEDADTPVEEDADTPVEEDAADTPVEEDAAEPAEDADVSDSAE